MIPKNDHERTCATCQRLGPRLDFARHRARQYATEADLLARLAIMDAVDRAFSQASAVRGLHRLMAVEDVSRFTGEGATA
jgi:hypothetical protein